MKAVKTEAGGWKRIGQELSTVASSGSLERIASGLQVDWLMMIDGYYLLAEPVRREGDCVGVDSIID